MCGVGSKTCVLSFPVFQGFILNQIQTILYGKNVKVFTDTIVAIWEEKNTSNTKGQYHSG